MSIAEGVDELTPLQVADLGEHASQKGVACDVERNTETQVTGTLVHLARELSVCGDVELGEDVAGWKSHLWEGRRVPGCHEDSPAVWVFFQLLDERGQLVHSLSLVVVMHGLVLSPEVPPLEPIHWAKVPLFTLC